MFTEKRLDPTQPAPAVLLLCRDREKERALREILRDVSPAAAPSPEAPPLLLLTDNPAPPPEAELLRIPRFLILDREELDRPDFTLPEGFRDVLTVPFQASLLRRRVAGAVEAERRRREEAAAPLPFWVKSPGGEILRANPALARLLGRPLEEILRRPLASLSPGGPAEAALLRALGRETGPWSGLVELPGEEGIPVRFHLVQTPFSDPAFPPDSLACTLVDAAPLLQRRRQEAFRREEELLGRLARGVAHDFNNSLGGILSAAELLGMQLREDPKADKYLRIIRDSAEQAAALTETLTALSGAESPSCVGIDLRSALEEALRELAPEQGALRVELTGPPVPKVRANPALLQNILIALCRNAFQATPAGGTLTIRFEEVYKGAEACAASPFAPLPGGYAGLCFRDEGPGIPREILPRLFDPYFTTRPKGEGKGWGLALAARNTLRLGGDLRLSSAPDEGTAALLHLPLATPAAPRSLAVPPSAAPPRRKILVVEDEPALLTMLTEVLSEEGYTILTAEDGKRALFQFKRHPGEIDLILMDMIMPDMTGSESSDAIRRISPQTKILFMSGYFTEEIMRETERTGFLHKPFDKTTLLKGIARLLSQN